MKCSELREPAKRPAQRQIAVAVRRLFGRFRPVDGVDAAALAPDERGGG